MMNANDRSPSSGQMRGFGLRRSKQLITIGFLAAMGLGAVMWSGCNGDNCCSVCRADCEKAGIPRGDPGCNCAGCKEGC